MKRIVLFVIIALNFLQGCDSFAIKDHVIGNYYLVAMFNDKELALTNCDPETSSTYGTIVPNTVFAVGYNEKYIIVKQHSLNLSTGLYGETNYYIVLIEKELTRANSKNFIGPLTYEQFLAKRHEFNISDRLKFSKEYEDLK